MTKTCPSCGAATAPEMRFCRRCGSPLRVAGADDNSNNISPIAATIPLTDEGRTTHGLSAEDARRPGPDTTRVNRADLDALLRPARTGQPSNRQPHTGDPHATTVAEHAGQQTHADTSQNFDPDANGALPASNSDARSSQSFPQTLDAASADAEEELTITVARPQPSVSSSSSLPTPHFEWVPHPVAVTSHAQGEGSVQSADAPHNAPPPTTPGAPRSRKVWYVAAGGALFLLLMTAAGVWLGTGYFRRPAQTNENSNAGIPPPADAKQLFEEKLAEAESLLAAGDLDSAIARLKEATILDPSNMKARRRLGDLLLDNGKRREAIEQFRAITTNDPRDAEAWRSLARAQLDESLHADAVESYRRLIALNGESSLSDNELLSYAESLRLSERAEEARPLYERLASSSFADVASAARLHLAELAAASSSASPTPAPTPDASRDARAQLNQNRSLQPSPTPAALTQGLTPTPVPTPAPTPQQPTPPPSSLTAANHFARGEQLWSSNRGAATKEFSAAAAKGNFDAFYYLGLNIVQGKAPGSLQRAELNAALQYFQNAQRGTRFRAEARRYEDQLGKEFDRRRQQ